MEENTNNVKITYAKNLPKLNFNLTITSPIDTNVNIKSVLDVYPYIYDTKIDCGNGKAIINGKLGIKVLYIDTDNITNTLTETQTFTESYVDSSITSDCVINILDNNITHSILSTENTLKINCDVAINPILYLNLPLNTNNNYENMIVKKSEIQTNSINQFINTSFEYTTTFETKQTVSKILSHSAYFTNTNTVCGENNAIVEGKLYSTLVFESTENDQPAIKQITDCFNIKQDIPLSNLSSDCMLDISFSLDKSKEIVTVETEDGNNIVSVKNTICIFGVSTKNVSIDVIDDLYSIENEIELSSSKRELTKNVQHFYLEESNTNEINLTNSETAIDEIISNLNIVGEITNSYLKDNQIYIEGIILSNLTYIDENKDYKNRACEVPFIVNTKINANSLPCMHSCVTVKDCKIKVKRGTIIEIEYSVAVNICVYTKADKDIVTNFKIGKPLNFANTDYQIFLVKPNETMWELCKRIKTTPENLIKYNKNLPNEFTGTEKVVVKR